MVDKDINEIVKEMFKITEYFGQKDVYGGYDGDSLSSGGIKLSSLKTTYGWLLADLELNTDLLEVQYGIDEANEYLKLRNGDGKISIDDAKMMVRVKLADAKKELITQQANVRKLKGYHRNVEGVITNVQTRVSLLKHEQNAAQLNR